MRLVEHTQQGRNSFLEIACWIDYDLGDDDSVTIKGVWLTRRGEDDLDITYMLTAGELDRARQNVIWQLEQDADRREALREDAAEARMEHRREIAHEMQQDAMREQAAQRGIR